MSTSLVPNLDETRAKLVTLFQDQSPVLVEVRFPKMGTASDWFLCEDEGDFDAILARLSAGAEIHMSSVWELQHCANSIVVRL